MHAAETDLKAVVLPPVDRAQLGKWLHAAQADNTLSKSNRAGSFDAARSLHTEMISAGMESAIASGNWTIRRFRMERKGVTQVGSRRMEDAVETTVPFSAIVTAAGLSAGHRVAWQGGSVWHWLLTWVCFCQIVP